MKILIFSIIIFIIFFLFISGTQITFKPFSISFPRIVYAIGMCLVMAGLITICAFERAAGYKEGYRSGIEPQIDSILKAVEDYNGIKK